MYKIKYLRKSREDILKFIDSYKKASLDLFNDTGIFYEDLIRENYINNAKKFKSEIKNEIEKIFIEDKIYWYQSLENNKFRIVCRIRYFRFFIHYSENIKNKERIIEKILINKI